MDYIVRATAADGQIRAFAATTRETVETARQDHNTSPVATAALGRLLTAGAMMGVMMKGDKDLLTLRIHAGGPLNGITVTADSKGNVKGYVANPKLDLPLNENNGKLDVGTAVGKHGMLYIIKDLGIGKPYVGMTPIVSGEIAEDFTNYFATSEQTPSVIALGVLVDKNGIRSAGGYKLSLMPDATDEIISKIEEQVGKIDPVSKMLDEQKTLEEIAKEVTGDSNLKVLAEINPEYKCNCSREKCEKGLIAIGKEELQKIIDEEEKIEIACNFCDKKYEFTREDMKKLLNNK